MKTAAQMASAQTADQPVDPASAKKHIACDECRMLCLALEVISEVLTAISRCAKAQVLGRACWMLALSPGECRMPLFIPEAHGQTAKAAPS